MDQRQQDIIDTASKVMAGHFFQRIDPAIFARVAQAITDATGCPCTCDAALNPPEQIVRGIVTARVDSPFGRFLVASENEDFEQRTRVRLAD